VAGMCEPDWIALRFAPVIHILLRGPYPSISSGPSAASRLRLLYLSAPANKFASLPNKKAIQLR
jgi:hypothetical protein